jgi:hypothetical protein
MSPRLMRNPAVEDLRSILAEVDNKEFSRREIHLE